MNKKEYLLLEYLDMNSRASLGDLANKLRISKQAVSMKLRNLKASKIVDYVAVVDFFKLGYSNTHLYLKMDSIKPSDYERKLNYLKTIKNITWISEFIGEYDLGISIFYKSLSELSSVLNKIYSTFEKSIHKKSLHFIKSHTLPRISLVNARLPQNAVHIEATDSIFKPTKTQKRILAQLENNSRATYSELSNAIRISIPAVAYNIKKLEKENIIKAYKIFIDYNSLGFLWNLCIIEPKAATDIPSFIEILRKGCTSPFISCTVENTIIIDFLTKDYNQLKNFLNSLGSTKRSPIKSYKILNVNRLIKLKNVFD